MTGTGVGMRTEVASEFNAPVHNRLAIDLEHAGNLVSGEHGITLTFENKVALLWFWFVF